MDDELKLDKINDVKIDFNEKEKKEITFDFAKNKAVIYSALFYSFGLFIGAYLYKITQFESINKLLKPEESEFLNLLLTNFCLYFSIFVIAVFLGFCLIGYPIINIIPTVIGLTVGIRIAYFYLNYSVKGIGYSIIMLIPFAALFLTVIAFTIQISAELSKKLVSLSRGEKDSEEFEIKKYIKSYLLFALLVILTAVLNSALSCLLFSVVTI